MYVCVPNIHSWSKRMKKVCASAGNRTRAARVAGEHSTTEPPMLHIPPGGFYLTCLYW